jgi:hypothetical protein
MASDDILNSLLDRFDAGVVGEEANGARRVAFSRSCEMVESLCQELADLELDLVFPDQGAGPLLFLNIVALQDCLTNVPQSLFNDFKWLDNRTGMYTFRKSAMAGICLRQLFLQLQSNFTPYILEDDPGTDQVYLHVSKRRVESVEDETANAKRQKRGWIPLWVFVLVLAMLLHFNLPWVLKTLSTVFTD